MAKDKIEELWTTSTTGAEKPEEYLPPTKEALDLEFSKEKLLSGKQNREQRKKYATYIFIFVCAYMLIAITILALSGYGILHISDSVLIALLTTTTANMIGLFTIVARYLFYRR